MRSPRYAILALAAASFIVPALALAQAPSCSLSANPSSVVPGGTANLYWNSTGATSCSITSISNCSTPSGIQGVIPTGNGTTYTGTFTGPGGTATCSVRVDVVQSTGGYYYSTGGTSDTTGGASGGTGGTIQGGSNQSKTPTVQYGSTGGAGGTTQPAGTVTNPTYPSLGTVQAGQTTQAPASSGGSGTGLVPCSGLDCQFCNLAELIQNIINWVLGISIPIAMALFAYAGFLYATSGGSSESVGKAKGVFSTVGMGFLLALGGWLIINTLLNIILASGPYKQGSWFSISCVAQESRLTNANPGTILSDLLKTVQQGPGGVLVPGSSTTGTAGTTLCTNADCSPTTLQSAGFASQSVANAMSCIAMTESTGNTNTKPSSTGACGLFQLTSQTSSSNWQQFLKTSQAQGLNCSTAGCNNAACNTAGAVWLYNQSGYQPWTGVCNNPSGCGAVGYGQPWNANARTCVSTYDPSAKI